MKMYPFVVEFVIDDKRETQREALHLVKYREIPIGIWIILSFERLMTIRKQWYWDTCQMFVNNSTKQVGGINT